MQWSGKSARKAYRILAEVHGSESIIRSVERAEGSRWQRQLDNDPAELSPRGLAHVRVQDAH